jgi:hypothetical protein
MLLLYSQIKQYAFQIWTMAVRLSRLKCFLSLLSPLIAFYGNQLLARD